LKRQRLAKTILNLLIVSQSCYNIVPSGFTEDKLHNSFYTSAKGSNKVQNYRAAAEEISKEKTKH